MQDVILNMFRFKIGSYNKLVFNLFVWAIFAYFLQSLYAWFLWGDIIKSSVLLICASLCVLNYNYNTSQYTITNNKKIFIYIFILAQLYIVRDAGILSLIRALFNICVVSNIVMLNNNTLFYIFKFTTKYYGIISMVSLLGWILFLCNVDMPYFNIMHPVYQYSYKNYYIFLYNGLAAFPRFCSIFLEPGHYGMISVFILFVNRFNLKNKYVLFILIGTIFSFSLSAYILIIVSVFLLLFRFTKTVVVLSLGLILFVIQGVSFSKNYNDGNNMVNTLILNRLEVSDGGISGNNRFSSDLEEYYSKYIATNAKWYGVGKEYESMVWAGGNAGYKVFIIEHGIIGVTFIGLFYFLLASVGLKHQRDSYIFLVIYILTFLQASYPFWFCEILLYISGLSVLRSSHKQVGTKVTFSKKKYNLS